MAANQNVTQLTQQSTTDPTSLFYAVTGGTNDTGLPLSVLSPYLTKTYTGFTQSGTGVVARTVQGKLRDVINVKDFGAVGDGTTDDTAALTAAINFVYAATYAPKLNLGSGYYRITSPLPDLKGPITIEGDNPRTCQLLCSGTLPILNIRGTGTRATDITLRNLTLNGNSMTAGFLVNQDWTQNVIYDKVYWNNPFNAVSIRQAGNTQFRSCLIDYVRGTQGVYAYATNTARNGQNDQIDVIIFESMVIQSNYVSGPAPTNNPDMLVLDGRVQTVQFNGLRLLNAYRGLVTQNTSGVAANFVPRFLTGTALEVENMYAQCVNMSSCLDFWINNIFIAGSQTQDGMMLSSAVGNFRIDKGTINSNWLGGLNTNSASDIDLGAVDIYNNSLVGVSVKSGIYVSGSGIVRVRGGLCGKATWLPAYTEPQKYGIELDSGFTGIIISQGVDLRGNATGSLYPGVSPALGSSVSGCPGFNPGGTGLVTVGASPFTYKAGLATENVNLYGGTGVVSTINGVAVANTVPAAFTLAPLQSVTITYSTVPTMAINKV